MDLGCFCTISCRTRLTSPTRLTRPTSKTCWLVDLLTCCLVDFEGKKNPGERGGLAGIALCRLDWRNDYMISIAFFTSSNTASGPPVPSIM